MNFIKFFILMNLFIYIVSPSSIYPVKKLLNDAKSCSEIYLQKKLSYNFSISEIFPKKYKFYLHSRTNSSKNFKFDPY